MRVIASVIGAGLICNYRIPEICKANLDIVGSINVVGLAFIVFSGVLDSSFMEQHRIHTSHIELCLDRSI